MNFKIGENSIWEFLLAAFWVFLVFAIFAGTFLLFFAALFGNIRDRWPHYSKQEKTKVTRNLILFFGTMGFLLWLGAAISL